MQLFIKIQNDGEIDQLAFRLIGASTKREDNKKIGFFGSGNKYAIALLMRKNIYFRIFSGKKEIKFDKKPVEFRDRKYEVITINGKETSMTTDMGVDWQDWFIIREFYCNALDEGEAKISVEDEIKPIKGKTTIFIEKTETLGKFFGDIRRYILTTNNDVVTTVKTSYGDVTALTPLDGEFISYRKGIRINEENKSKSLYRYNFELIDINESRIASAPYQITERIAAFFAKTTDKKIINNYLENYRDTKEKEAHWEYLWNDSLSEQWREVLEGKRVFPESIALLNGDTELKQSSCIVPDELARKINKEFPDINVVGYTTKQMYAEVDATGEELYKIDKAKRALYSLDYQIDTKVVVANFKEQDVVGAYDSKNKLIVLAKSYLDSRSDSEIKNTLLEEYFHSLGYSDASREFVSFLIEELIRIKTLCAETGVDYGLN